MVLDDGGTDGPSVFGDAARADLTDDCFIAPRMMSAGGIALRWSRPWVERTRRGPRIACQP
jgi:hypothetical protein